MMGLWTTLGGKLAALGTLAVSMPLGRVLARDHLEPAAPQTTPVVFVHGLLGDPSNFLLIRAFLSGLGIRSFASFSYAPRLDYQTLAPRLGEMLAEGVSVRGGPDYDSPASGAQPIRSRRARRMSGSRASAACSPAAMMSAACPKPRNQNRPRSGRTTASAPSA